MMSSTVGEQKPLWHLPIEMKRRYPDIRLFCDPSHMGGRRELVAPLAQQALDLSYDGLFVEAHCNPDAALSDAQQQLTPAALLALLDSLTVRSNGSLPEDIASLRKQIDGIDEEILRLLARRQQVSGEIGEYKARRNMPVLQSERYREIIENRAELARTLGLDESYVKAVMELIHRESVRRQMRQENTTEA